MKCKCLNTFTCYLLTIHVYVLCRLGVYLLLTFMAMLSLHQHQFLSEALQWRAQTDPDHVLYVLLNAKVLITQTSSF